MYKNRRYSMSATVYAFSNGSLFDTCGFGVYHDQTLPAARSAQSRPLLHDITNVKVHSSEALASRCTDWRLAQFISMLRCSAHPHLLSPGRCSLTLRRRLALLSVHQPSRSYIVAAASTHAKAAADPLPSQASAAPTSEPQAAPAKAALRIQEASQAIGGVPRVVLKKGKTAIFRSGNPMVYSGAVDRVLAKPQPQSGDTVVVTDGAETPIAWGVFNPHSMFRVRIMQLEEELRQHQDASQVLNMPQLIAARLHTAVQLRTALGLGINLSPTVTPQQANQQPLSHGSNGDTASSGQTHSHAAAAALTATNLSQPASASTDRGEPGIASTARNESGVEANSRATAVEERQRSGGLATSSSRACDVYRVVNSEGDRLSGLIVDRVGDQLVVASSAAWVERYREVISQQLMQTCGTGCQPVWKQSKDMLKEEGIEIAAADSSAPELAAAQVQVEENGVRFWVSTSTGQKTGFYADQRDSRLAMRHLAQGRGVLDLCCYTGGFALNALAGGATHVTGVESSAPALELADSNAKLNGWQSSQFSFLKDDITKYMQQQISEGVLWDIVVLDPPKLAPNRKSLNRAMVKYRKLNTLAMRVVKPGGMLMTCSCSGAVTLDDHFLPMLKEAARAAGRHISILRIAGAGPDHPTDPGYPEGLYLKNVLLLVT